MKIKNPRARAITVLATYGGLVLATQIITTLCNYKVREMMADRLRKLAITLEAEFNE